MYIHEAITAARSKGSKAPFIRRKCWPYNKVTWKGCKILPANTPFGCLAYSSDVPPEKWVPCAADLSADDWEPCL